MFTLLTLVVLGLTAVIAGFVPTLLFLGGMVDRRMLIVGGLATAGAYVPVSMGAPGLAVVNVNGLLIYPLWALLIGFLVAIVWRVLRGLGPSPVAEEERLEEVRARALEKARARRAGEGDR